MAPSRKQQKKRPIDGKDLYRLLVPTSISMSPDEKQVACTVERMDEKEKKYFTNIYMCEVDGDDARRFTHGNQVDGKPAWSPDGSRLAFVSRRDDKTAIYIMPSGGGAERKLKELDAAITSLQWTPDGRELVFAMRYNDSHFIKDEKEKKKAPVYRHVTRLFFRLDALGYLPQDTFQIYAVDVDSGELRQLTRGKKDNMAPDVSADGKWVCYISNRSKDPDLEPLRNDLFLMPLKGGRERKVPTPDGPIEAVRFSPNGKYLAFIGHDDPNDAWGVRNSHVWLVGRDGSPKARDLMPTFDRMAYDQSISDLSDVHETAVLQWSGDSRRIYFLSSDTGATNVYYIPRGGGKPTRIFKGKCHVKGLSLGKRGNRAAIIYSDLKNPGDIMTFPAAYGGEKKTKRHTDLNSFLRSDVALGRTREVFFKSFDGTEVQGWLVTPPGFKTTRKYPAILEIHGGPRVQYAHTFFHEMLFLASKGYVVLYTNPRGGSGRGETWADAIAGGWGELDYKDCMAAADYLEKQKFINSKRIGVTGGSYGGYMTNWLIGHTDRFRAAVTQRSVVNLESMHGSSDIGFMLDREFAGSPWSNPGNYRNCSPLTYFKKVRTPVLIIHSEQDLRCPIEQAEQMFVMLKMLGRKVEMVRFPEEPHGLSRHGRPDRRLARLDWIQKWFDRYLKR